MQLLEAAGLPAGVINLVLGDGPMVSEVALADPRLAGIHFTGSTATFQRLWREVGNNISNYRSYPRLVGETGGKDFIVAHSSADADVLVTALIRGAYDYQGQKCSATSRAFVPKSLWNGMKRQPGRQHQEPDLRRRRRLSQLRRRGDRPARLRPQRRGDRAGQGRGQHATSWPAAPTTTARASSSGPTLMVGTDPTDKAFTTEYFGPILSLHVYDDSTPNAFADVCALVDQGSEYGLTGAVIAQDRGGHRDGQARAAVRRRQLLHQRQAERRGRRAAALRWGARLGHQRQGRCAAEPAALDLGPDHQGDLRAADHPPLPAPGRTDGRSLDARPPPGPARRRLAPRRSSAWSAG